MLDIIINPFITLLLFYYSLLGQNVFLAIIAFTITIRGAMTPLTLKQYRSAKEMQKVQPELKALQEKYKNNREELVQKQMELYREHKINPLAGCLPLLVQLPIFLSLWRAIVTTLALSPADLLSLSDRILIPGLDHLVPLNHQFLWLNLAVPDPYLLLPVLVVITTWLQQKLLMPSMPKKKPGEVSNDPADQAAAISRQMTTYMPFIFGFISLTYSSGLSIYIIVANLIGIIQYRLLNREKYTGLFTLVVPEGEAGSEEFMEPDGRRRKPGISDTRWVEGKGTKTPETDDFTGTNAEKRSERVERAKNKASRVKAK